MTERLEQLISPNDVLEMLGISKTTLWRMSKDKGFPRPVEISPGRKGYLKNEVADWLNDKIAKRNAAN